MKNKIFLIFLFLFYALPVWSVTITWDNPSVDCSGAIETGLSQALIVENGKTMAALDAVGKEGAAMTWDTGILGDGGHTIGVILVDKAGNKSDTCGVTPTITIDNGDHTSPAGCANLGVK